MQFPDFPVPETERPVSIRALRALPQDSLGIYLERLLPPGLLEHYDTAPSGPWSREARGPRRALDGARNNALRVEFWPVAAAPDPSLVLELVDTYYGHVEAAFIALADVLGPRYNVDRDADGKPLPLGSPQRNLREELRALADGLAPNQIRPGVGQFRQVIEHLEGLCDLLSVGILYVAPLAYHNAIQYERYGFTYASGKEEMDWIHQQFQPDGVLRRRMDGSRPFRQPEMAATVRGRSWAIHDGVLERRWLAPQMYKFIGRAFRTRTFPDAVW